MRIFSTTTVVLAMGFGPALSTSVEAQYLQPGQQPYVQPGQPSAQPAPTQYVQPVPAQYVQPGPMVAPNEEAAIVESATVVLNEIMAAPRKRFPWRFSAMPRESSFAQACSKADL